MSNNDWLAEIMIYSLLDGGGNADTHLEYYIGGKTQGFKLVVYSMPSSILKENITFYREPQDQ